MLTDYPTWSARRWSELVPDCDAGVVLTAINLGRVATQFRQEQTRALRLWRQDGVSSVDDYRILGLLRQVGDPGATSSEIAEALALKKAMVSVRLDKLEKHQLVLRGPNELDGRSWLLWINPSKVEMVDEMYRAVAGSYERLLSKLSANQRASLDKALQQLRK